APARAGVGAAQLELGGVLRPDGRREPVRRLQLLGEDLGDLQALRRHGVDVPVRHRPVAGAGEVHAGRMNLAAEIRNRLTALEPLAVLAQDKPPAKAAAKDKEPPLAKVNGVAVPASYLEFMMQQQRGRGTPDNPQTRQMMRDELVNREIVSQEAQRQGLAKDA